MPKLELELPADQDEWDALARKIVRIHMTAKGLNYVDLAKELNRLGMETDNKLLSNKLRIGKFSATFFLRALVACGVNEISIPERR